MSLLAHLWGESRQQLLMAFGGRGELSAADIEREWPGITRWSITQNCKALVEDGWLDGYERRFRHRPVTYAARLRADTVEAAADELRAALPGCWPAQELDLAALAVETNLWRSPRKLRAVAGLVAGCRTPVELSSLLGGNWVGVDGTLKSLEVVGLASRGATGGWAYTPTPLHLWTFLGRLGAAVPPTPLVDDLYGSGTERLAAVVAAIHDAALLVLSAPSERRVAGLELQLALGKLAWLIGQGQPDLPPELLAALQEHLDLPTEELPGAVRDGLRARELLEAHRSSQGLGERLPTGSQEGVSS